MKFKSKKIHIGNINKQDMNTPIISCKINRYLGILKTNPEYADDKVLDISYKEEVDTLGELSVTISIFFRD